MDYIAIDLLGPLIKSENGCTDILVITDRISKFVVCLLFNFLFRVVAIFVKSLTNLL